MLVEGSRPVTGYTGGYTRNDGRERTRPRSTAQEDPRRRDDGRGVVPRVAWLLPVGLTIVLVGWRRASFCRRGAAAGISASPCLRGLRTGSRAVPPSTRRPSLRAPRALPRRRAVAAPSRVARSRARSAAAGLAEGAARAPPGCARPARPRLGGTPRSRRRGAATGPTRPRAPGSPGWRPGTRAAGRRRG